MDARRLLSESERLSELRESLLKSLCKRGFLLWRHRILRQDPEWDPRILGQTCLPLGGLDGVSRCVCQLHGGACPPGSRAIRR